MADSEGFTRNVNVFDIYLFSDWCIFLSQIWNTCSYTCDKRCVFKETAPYEKVRRCDLHVLEWYRKSLLFWAEIRGVTLEDETLIYNTFPP